MRKILSFAILTIWLTGCASASPTQKGAVGGSAIGAGIGAIIGHQSGNTVEGALIGAAAGGLGGALIGEAMSTQFCPTCGRSYTGGQTHCPLDGTALRTKGAPPQTAQQQNVETGLSKYCPACGRSYGDDKTYCSVDGTQLKQKQA